jgi:alkylation response protein AidB-like acyl-CoA dehydrogenase
VSDPDLLVSESEELLRDSVRALLRDRVTTRHVLDGLEGHDPHDPALWQGLGGLGALGLLVPEARGGHGAGPRECAVVCEELGRAVAPVPFVASAVLATSLVVACSTGDRSDELLSMLAGGSTVAVVAIDVATCAGDGGEPSVRVVDGRLHGSVRGVADVARADVFLVPAGDGLYVVETSGAGVDVRAHPCLDLTRSIGELVLDAAVGHRLADRATADAALRAATLVATAMVCNEQLGIAEWCLDETVRYVSERIQFGRPVGSFQALKHRLADVWLGVVGARAAARNAADALARDAEDAPVSVALAKVCCSDVAVRAAEECVQLHGGIGMTWEHPAHLFLKRAKFDATAFGTPGRQYDVLADLIDLRAGA